jgi:hypothetical protein
MSDEGETGYAGQDGADGSLSHDKWKVPTLPFSGKEEEWTAWKLRFSSWMKIINVYDVMAGKVRQGWTHNGCLFWATW